MTDEFFFLVAKKKIIFSRMHFLKFFLTKMFRDEIQKFLYSSHFSRRRSSEFMKLIKTINQK